MYIIPKPKAERRMISAPIILIALAIILATVALFKPEYPLNSVAIILLGAALVVGHA